MDDAAQTESGSRLLKVVEALSISPQDAKSIVAQYKAKGKKSKPSATDAEIQKIVAKKIISRYSYLAATSGGITSLAGVVPGVGTAISMLGGGLTDAAFCMKLQVDMTMCLAESFGWDLNSEDAKHLSFLIAVGGSLEKLSSEVTTRVASQAGVKMLRQYLKGATLQAIKVLFAKFGVTFTRKALEKAIPFGIGVAISGTANYALTKYVGHSASKWFVLDHEMGNKPSVGQPESGSDVVVKTAAAAD